MVSRLLSLAIATLLCGCSSIGSIDPKAVRTSANYNVVVIPDHPTRPTIAIATTAITVIEQQASSTPPPTTAPTFRPPRCTVINGWIYITGTSLTQDTTASNADKSVVIGADGCRILLSNCLTAPTTTGGDYTPTAGKWRAYCMQEDETDYALVTLNHGTAHEVSKTLDPLSYINIEWDSGGFWKFSTAAAIDYSETNDGDDNTDASVKWQINDVYNARRTLNIDHP